MQVIFITKYMYFLKQTATDIDRTVWKENLQAVVKKYCDH